MKDSNYFTDRHFEILRKYAGTKTRPGNIEQTEEYPVLKDGYRLTLEWAKKFQESAFQKGFVKMRNSPVNQGGTFTDYTWAKIYPEENSPVELAYTVGISVKGFTVKIDTVNAKRTIRDAYLAIRGNYDTSEIVSHMSIEDGLRMTMDELVKWSVDQIYDFGPTYEKLCKSLELKESNNAALEDIHHLLVEFIEQAKTGSQKRKQYSRNFYGLNSKASFGQGAIAKIPWFSFLAEGQKTSDDIYPVFLYFKEVDCLILCCGDSEDNNPTFSWPELGLQTNKDFLKKNYDFSPTRYGHSKTFKAYDIKEKLSKTQINQDFYELVGIYKNVLKEQVRIQEPEGEYSMEQSNMNLNTILYGPPGTGKTYNTIEWAVNAAEPNFVFKNRVELKAKYDVLLEEGRIKFVTFHQSYGYEEFVEGLKAKTEGGEISYVIESGVFKDICKLAESGYLTQEDPLLIAIETLKEDLEGDFKTLETSTGKEFSFTFHGNTTFRVYPKGSIHKDLGRGYAVSIEKIVDLCNGKNPKDIYNSSYAKAILGYLQESYNIVETKDSFEKKNYVLIIDEINRGNISKIFGELITLIEPSKRIGAPESLSVQLPYSKDSFSMPDNLFVLGTMNTADRSLAVLDTALRRRFDFVEMMPDSTLLDKTALVKGINLKSLMDKLNERITALYDREHTLGHAFFMPVKDLLEQNREQEAFETLIDSFKNKVLPLLEEYFFEDWSKIRLVLGDNYKEQDEQFIIEDIIDTNSLFGPDNDIEDYEQDSKLYRRVTSDAEVWENPDSYKRIYQY